MNEDDLSGGNGVEPRFTRTADRNIPLNPYEWLVAISFCAVAASITLVFKGYYFGAAEHQDQLPFILRALNEDFAKLDFFVNSTDRFGPRTYYRSLITSISRMIGLETTFFVLTWFSNFAVGLVTWFAAMRFSKGAMLCAMLASTFALAIMSVEPGRGTRLFSNHLQPADLVMGLSLLSLWLGIERRPISCAVTASAALIVHPLLGLEAGILGVGAGALGKVWETWPDMLRRAKEFGRDVAALVILGAATYALWLTHRETSISDQEFIDMYAYYRAPHHFIPSSWGFATHLLTLAFIAATAAAFFAWWRSNYACRSAQRSTAVVLILIIGLMLGGYVFVEIIPSRTWVNANTYRLFTLFRWLAFILIAYYVASSIVRRSEGHAMAGAMVILASSGKAQPILALFGFVVDWFSSRLSSKSLGRTGAILSLFVPIATSGVVLKLGNLGETAHVMVMVLVIAWFMLIKLRWLQCGVPLIMVVGVIALVWVHLARPIDAVARIADRLHWQLSLDDHTDDGALIARAVRRVVRSDSLFVAPPGLGLFRTIAERAVVVDFTAFPFQDDAMLEWRNRMRFCYGDVKESGFAGLRKMEVRYKGITDKQLAAIAARYGVTHAVLYAETPTHFKLVVTNPTYKVVSIAPNDEN